MLKQHYITLCLALCVSFALAQSPSDTLPKQKNLGIVVVESYTYTPAKRTTNLSTAIVRNKGNSLADVLQENAGIYLKNYGPGMLSTIAFRGTGAEHTALVWNGININYPMLGLADFAVIPASGFSSVNVVHGSSSSYFGSSAIGGAVVLEDTLVFEPQDELLSTTSSLSSLQHGFNQHKVKTSATFEAGSYNRWLGSVSNYVGTQKFTSRTTLQLLNSENNFNFINSVKITKPEERQVNSALQQYALMQDFNFVTGKKSYATIRGWYNYTEREIPPTLTATNTQAWQKDESVRIMGEWHLHGATQLTIRGAYVNDYIGYKDNLIVSNARVTTSTIQANHLWYMGNGLGGQWYLHSGLEGQYFTADIKDYNGFKTEWRTSAYANLQYMRGRFSANIMHRQILVQGNVTAAAPTLGLTHNFWKAGIIVKANISRSFRVPTLNERYWVPGGNPNLKPEGGWAYELGISKAYSKWGDKNRFSISGEATGFYMNVNNWLQWQPTAFSYWMPVNLKQVISRGVELSLETKWGRNKFFVQLNGAYTLAIATNKKSYTTNTDIVGKDLIYAPRHVATGGVSLSYYGFSLFCNVQYTGLRYITTDNAQQVNPYWLLNARISKPIRLKSFTLDVWVQAYNITNNSYFNLPYRPMPLRNYRTGLTITFEKQLNNTIHEK